MGLTARQIEDLARTIVNRLEDRGLVEFGDAEAGIEIVNRVLMENFRAIESLLREARSRLGVDQGRPVSEEDLDLEIQKVAAERGFLL